MQTEYAVKNSDQSQETVTSNLCARLHNANSVQRDYIDDIESRLHSILNLRSPKPDPTNKGEIEAPLVDFTTTMENEIKNVQAANDRLQIICDHFRKII